MQYMAINLKWLKFLKGDFIHVYGYFNKRTKNGKTYKNFVVMSMNKIEKKEENEEE